MKNNKRHLWAGNTCARCGCDRHTAAPQCRCWKIPVSLTRYYWSSFRVVILPGESYRMMGDEKALVLMVERLENMAKRKYNDERVAQALRNYAEFVCDHPEQFSHEDGQVLDRALRSCGAISDIDIIWVRWDYVAQQQHWMTTGELVCTNGRYEYPVPDAPTD